MAHNWLTIYNQIKASYDNGDLTENQFKVLVGLMKANDISGAIKGHHKILRRNKKTKEVQND